MTEHEIEQRLSRYFREEVGHDEAAPVTLRAALDEVVDLPLAGLFGSRRRLVLLAVAVMLTVAAIGTALAIGSGLIRPPRPAPLPAREGDMIAFARMDLAGGYGIYLIHPDGSQERLLTTAEALGKVSWSPDGRQFVIANSLGVHVMNADGSGKQSLVTDLGGYDGAAWSPDGVEIAFSLIDLASPADQWNIHVMNADGSNLRQLTDGPDLDLFAVWSPDSTRIVFVRESCTESGSENEGASVLRCTDGLFMMDADGSNLRQITDDPGIESYPDWSPDGRQIAFSQRPWPEGEGLPTSYNPPWDIWVLNVDDFTAHALTSTGRSELSPTWSPDGAQIAFAANTDGLMSIEVMDADGSNVRRLTTLSGMYSDPSWFVAAESPSP